MRIIRDMKNNRNRVKTESIMNEEKQKKYGIGGGIAVMMQVQMILVGIALIITGYGIVCSFDAPRRLVVYILQAGACLAILLFGFFHFHKKKTQYFKGVVYAYALLEAVRVSLLSTNGVDDWAGIVAKLILVFLACGLCILAAHLGEKNYNLLAYVIIFLEAALFLVFALHFATDGRLLFKVLPIVGILISGSICLFNEAKIRQKAYFEENEGK